MKNIILTLIIGLIAGVIDILPMIKMKQDKNSIASAFVFYLIMPFIIYGTQLFGMAWWLEGAVLTLALALPVLLIVAKTEKKAVPAIMITAIALGTLIGITGHFLKL
jgi:formate-dependent nitrite reductase membrane component NrfD